MQKAERVLVISHAHPDFSLGGGETAAYNLYKSLREHPLVGEAWFLARADRGRGPTGAISLRRPNEYLWDQAVHDWHNMKAANLESTLLRFAELVRALDPTIVYAHHYAHLGLEYLRVLRQVLPDVRIVMTLHEYMAICRNNGQMVKTEGMRLCSSESPDECHRCFPETAPEDFWLRKHAFMRSFDFVERFVAPSEFLRQRYIAWGLDANKIVVIENGQPERAAVPPRKVGASGSRNRFGYFGQINRYKGLDVLLKGLRALPRAARENVVLEVHGANLEMQEGELQAQVKELSLGLINSGSLVWMGPYRPEQLEQRMAGVDWVVVPSVWWENSPLVIQEAFACGRPVIASDIGGMAEKVRNGVDGIHVPVGNTIRWGEALVEAATSEGLWERLVAGINRPPTLQESANEYLSLIADPSQSVSISTRIRKFA